MHTHRHPFRWAPWIAALLLAGVVGVAAYNAGVSHALAINAAPAAAPLMWYPWFHPFGFVFPLFFLFFWFAIARVFFWGGPWRRGCYGYRHDGGVPPQFEAWHDRMHDRRRDGGDVTHI